MVKQKFNSNNRGFTFIELVIAVAMLTIIMGSIVQFMATTTVTYNRTNHDNEVQSQAQDVYDVINSCIMQANKVILYGDIGSGDEYFISDNQPKVEFIDPSTGKLLNSSRKTLKFSLPYDTSGEVKANAVTAKAFSILSKHYDDGSPTEYKDVTVKAIYFEYQTKRSGSAYEDCYATFFYNDGKLYLNRHYESEGTTYAGIMDMNPKKESILCKSLEKTDGFKVTVDANANCIGLILKFNNYKMSYETLGMTKIRNGNVLAR